MVSLGRLHGFGRCCAALLVWLLGLIALPAIGPELPMPDGAVVVILPPSCDELPTQRRAELIAHPSQAPPAVLAAIAAASSFSQPHPTAFAVGIVVCGELRLWGVAVFSADYVGTSDPVNYYDPSGLDRVWTWQDPNGETGVYYEPGYFNFWSNWVSEGEPIRIGKLGDNRNWVIMDPKYRLYPASLSSLKSEAGQARIMQGSYGPNINLRNTLQESGTGRMAQQATYHAVAVLQVSGDATQDTLNKTTLGLSDRFGYTDTAEIARDPQRLADMNMGGAGHMRTGGAVLLHLAMGIRASGTLSASGQGTLGLHAAGATSVTVNAARGYMATASAISLAYGVESAQAGTEAALEGRAWDATQQYAFAALGFLGTYAGNASLQGSVPRAPAVSSSSTVSASGSARIARPQSYDDWLKVADDLDVGTGRNQAVFYSGRGNRELAEQFAQQNSRVTLEMTPGGRWLDQQGLFGPNSPLTAEQATEVWSRLSRRFAQGASGNSVGFVRGARAEGIFNTVEYPALLDNPNVVNVLTGGH